MKFHSYTIYYYDYYFCNMYFIFDKLIRYTSKCCYEIYHHKINQNVMNDLINRITPKYSKFLINLIKEMLQFDEDKRPAF